MSLILDALRKSEHQRQRQVGPGLAVVPEAGERHRPPTWILVLAGLLVLNILVLAALLLTGRPAEQATTMTPAAAPPAAAPAAAAPTRPADTVQTAPLALPSRPRREDVRPLTTEVAAPAATAQPAGGAPRQAAPQPAPAVEQTTADARLPRFTDLVIRGELNVPNMHLDIHVYSGNPAERFVFINMRKYLEGEATHEGPRIERITSDGVVMDHQGQRFFLSRD
jgi:general secretion pathway protein B